MCTHISGLVYFDVEDKEHKFVEFFFHPQLKSHSDTVEWIGLDKDDDEEAYEQRYCKYLNNIYPFEWAKDEELWAGIQEVKDYIKSRFGTRTELLKFAIRWLLEQGVDEDCIELGEDEKMSNTVKTIRRHLMNFRWWLIRITTRLHIHNPLWIDNGLWDIVNMLEVKSIRKSRKKLIDSAKKEVYDEFKSN